MTALQKACVGATGGLCLVILKLIEAGFFYPNLTSTVAVVSYMTYASYLVLGMLVAVYFTDHDLPRERILKSAFISGLLAPSILLALLKAPATQAGETVASPNSVIPAISSVLMPSLLAQQPEVPPRRPLPNEVIVVRQEALRPTISEAFKQVIGRPLAAPHYLYVIGSTGDRTKAIATAAVINTALDAHARTSMQAPRARVIQIEGGNSFYVVAGGLQTNQAALITAKTAKDTALGLASDPASANAARLLHQGVLVDGSRLPAAR